MIKRREFLMTGGAFALAATPLANAYAADLKLEFDVLYEEGAHRRRMIASLSDPPLRLLLGSDSYNAAGQSGLQKLELDSKWRDLSVSTDYSADGPFSGVGSPL